MFNLFDYSWLSLGSLVLGLTAWVLPVVNIMRYGKDKHRNWIVMSIFSMSSCAISLWFQIIYNHHLVEIEDWSALMDTTGALVKVSAVLVIVTITLNIISMFLYKNKISE